jgi:hypothetical protein
MKTILVCRIGDNYGLGSALGMERRGTIWAVACDEATPGALFCSGKWYRRFDDFKSAEKFCQEA